jgi:hypothetical protein
MFYQILRSFLGPFAWILDYFSTRTEWITAFFSLYLVTYGLGMLQLSGIRKRTHSLIEEQGNKWLLLHPEATKQDLYDYFYPLWEAELRKWRYLFIPNKNDLWPVSVTPQHVNAKLKLTPESVHQHLVEAGPIQPATQD